MGENMKKRFVQTLITVFVMSSLIVTPVLATPQEDAQSLETQKEELEGQAADINSQLVGLLVSYDALQKDMADQEQKITQAQSDLEEAQAKEQKQYEDMKLRIKYIYEQGDTSAFEALVTAKSYAELVSKTEYVQNVHSYDRKKLKEYVETKEKVEALKTELEAGQADMEVMAADLSQQQTNLENTLADMRSRIADFDSRLADAKAQAAAQLDQLTEATQNVVASAQTGNGGGGKPSSSTNNSTQKPGNNTNNNVANNGNTENQSNSQGGGSSNNSAPPATKPGNASLGQQIANRGCEYVGNPYEYGGTSLTNGIDCSAFVQAIHRQFGISTPRDSWGQLSGGKAVAYSDIMPGDVVVYSNHVAIYIGGGKIVHASNSKPYPAGGIKISSPWNYRTVLGVRRYW